MNDSNPNLIYFTASDVGRLYKTSFSGYVYKQDLEKPMTFIPKGSILTYLELKHGGFRKGYPNHLSGDLYCFLFENETCTFRTADLHYFCMTPVENTNK
jgi:hypothetical protein